jgi:hypothetical protein
MATINEKTNIPLFAVLSAGPIIVGFIVWISMLYSNVSANTQDIQSLKTEKKEMVEELKKINESLTVIKTTLKIKGDK